MALCVVIRMLCTAGVARLMGKKKIREMHSACEELNDLMRDVLDSIFLPAE